MPGPVCSSAPLIKPNTQTHIYSLAHKKGERKSTTLWPAAVDTSETVGKKRAIREGGGGMREMHRKKKAERVCFEHIRRGKKKSSSLAPSFGSSILQTLLYTPFLFSSSPLLLSSSFSSHSSHLTSLWSIGAWSAEEYYGREMSAELRPVWKYACWRCIYPS